MKHQFFISNTQQTYYKANLHCHTTVSDGHLTPEQVKECYKQQGYSIVAFTDHNTYKNHTDLNDSTFLALAACEMDLTEPDTKYGFPRRRTYHINLFDTDPNQFRKEKTVLPLLRDLEYENITDINAYIKQMNELGFLVCYNHPYWSLQNYNDHRNLQGLWAMEIYNHGSHQVGLYGYTPQVYDEMLRNGQKNFCVAGDDNHNEFAFDHPFSDSFGGFTMIGTKDFTYHGIMKALQSGNFYSSMGPEIYEMTLTNHHLTIKTSPVEKIYVHTLGRDCYRKACPVGQFLTDAEFDLNGYEGYIRLDIQDARGLHANSNAYWIPED